MFTGIVEEMGEVLARQHHNEGIYLKIKGDRVLGDLALGDSIAVNGICLTVAELYRGAFSAEVMPETLRKTNLAGLKRGDRVNLERALPAGGRIGGHFVSGHIDGTGETKSIKREGNALVMSFQAPEQVLRYLVERGSVAVDGVSLTVVSVEADAFSVSIIPHTAKGTTLGYRGRGDTVNLEADMLVKYVEKILGKTYPEEMGRGVTYRQLEEKGFL